jgi:hypothetical protein
MLWGTRIIRRTTGGGGGGSGDIEGVTAGDGMTGGGTSGTVTLNVVANADGSIVVNANDVQLGALGYARVQTALALANSAIDVNAQQIVDLADPTTAQHAATKAYVDALVSASSTTVWSADSAVSSSAHANGVRYVPLRNAQSDTLTFQFASARTGTLELAVHYAMSAAEANGVRLRVDSLALSAGDNPSDALTTGTAFTLTASNDVFLHQITSSDSGDLSFAVTLADIVIVTITRLGSDGADTHTGDFRVYQVRAT